MDKRNDFHQMPPAPPMGRNGNVLLILEIYDVTGKRIRVRDCSDLKLFVWTSNPNNYIVFNKRDVRQEMFEDVLPIPDFFMKDLESGVIQYTYSYSADGSRNTYNKVRTITTEIYWKNQKFHDVPGMTFNSQTLEYLRDQIEQEKVDRYNQVKAIQDYVNNEYTNRLDDEIKRSTEVDVKMLETINGVEAGLKKADEEIKAKLAEEVKRSTEVDIQMFNLIKEIEKGASDSTKDVEDKVTDSDNRAQEAEGNLQASIDAETERATKAEKELNGLITNLESNIEDVRDSLFGNIVEVENNLVGNIQEVQKDFDSKLNSEIQRATNAEKELDSKFAEKIKTLKDKAISFDEKLKKAIEDEKERSNEMDVKHTNEITIEVNRAKAEEARIESLIGTEKNRATIIEGNLQKAIEAETNRATLVEKDLAEAVQKLKSSNIGKVSDLADKLDEEISRATGKETELSNAINATNSDLANEVSRATAKENELAGSIDSVSNNLNAEIQRSTEKDAELTKAIADVKADVNTNATSIESINQKLDVINGDGVGSINHAVEDAKHYTDDEIAKLKLENSSNLDNTLKDYATKNEVDDRIKGVIGTAPEALDTLGEIAEQLNKDNDAIKAINSILSGKANADDVYTKSEVDKKVSDLNLELNAEKSRATLREDSIEATANQNKTDIEALKARFDDHLANSNDNVTDISKSLNEEILRAKAAESELANNLASEVSRATDAENTLSNDLANETSRATQAESNLQSQIDVINGDSETIGSIAHSLDDSKHYTDDEIAKLKGSTEGSINGEIERATKVEQGLREDIDTLKQDVYTKAEVDAIKADLQKQLDDLIDKLRWKVIV